MAGIERMQPGVRTRPNGLRCAALTIAAGLALVAAAGAALPAWAGRAHTHGVGQLFIAVEGTRLMATLELPLDTLVGFERAPRNDAERASARAAIDRLRDGSGLIRPEAAARCGVSQTSVSAPVLEGAASSAAGHADALVTIVFECAEPARLATLEATVFDMLRRLERLEVQSATPGGQGRAVLRRSARVARLAP